jgi:hypothetical protein
MALCVALVAPRASSLEDVVRGADGTSADLRPSGAVLIGSSSFNQDFGRLIARELERMGYKVVRKGVSGAGLARPDFHDMPRELEAMPIDANTAAVFVYLGVNDAQAVWLHPEEREGRTWLPFGSTAWSAVYSQRTHDFLERICQRGARRAVVVLPVDVKGAELQARLVRIRELQVQAAAATSCAVAVQTAGDAGQFEQAGVAKRFPDGFHMTALGAQLVWERIQPQVLSLLELRGSEAL